MGYFNPPHDIRSSLSQSTQSSRSGPDWSRPVAYSSERITSLHCLRLLWQVILPVSLTHEYIHALLARRIATVGVVWFTELNIMLEFSLDRVPYFTVAYAVYYYTVCEWYSFSTRAWFSFRLAVISERQVFDEVAKNGADLARTVLDRSKPDGQ